MAATLPSVTRRRVLLGGAAAATIALAILLLVPDTRKPLASGTYGPPVERDLEEIRKDTLRVLVVQHHLTYERIKGGETGLEYELLKRIAHALGVPIKAVVVDRSDSLMPMLQRGAGDVIASQLPRKNPFQHAIIHTVPYRFVSPVFATLRRDHVLGINLEDRPLPDTAWVSAWSPFAPRERRFPGSEGSYDLKRRTLFTDTSRYGDNTVINVALGRVRAAVISDASAVYFAQRFPQLTFSAPFDASVPLVFGLRANARQLQRAIDKRLNDPQEKEAMAMLMSAYGREVPERRPLGAMPCTTDEAAVLPAYAHGSAGDGLHRDWELLAAIAFQNARADSAAWLAANQGIYSEGLPPRPEDPLFTAAQVRAAARYFAELDAVWAASVPDPDQRLRFITAAYTAGPGHLRDACVLAQRLQLDPQRWEGNVERAITLLALPRFFSQPGMNSGPCAGDVAFERVREVMCHYEHFHQDPK